MRRLENNADSISLNRVPVKVQKNFVFFRRATGFPRICLIAFLAIAFLLLGCSKEPEQKKRNVVESGDRVQFRLLNTHFDIPRKYFKGVTRTGSGTAETANLWALLPNFEAYDKAVNHHEFYEVRHKGRRIQVLLVVRSRVITVPKIVERYSALPHTVLGRHAGKYDEIRHGLEYYRTSLRVARSIYLYREKGTPILHFRCSEDEQALYPGCSVSWDYNEEIAVKFDFSKKYLPQWREIFSNVEALINGELDCCSNRAPAATH